MSDRFLVAVGIVGLLVVTAGTVPTAGAGGGSGGGPAGTGWTRGVYVSASVARSVYPRNALVQTTITVWNDSPHLIVLMGVCSEYNPWMEVESSTGGALYPPVLNFPRDSVGACGTGTGPLLRPGASFRTQVDAILRGPILRPEVSIFTPPNGSTTVVGLPLRVRLTSASAPHVTLTGSPHVSALVSCPRGASGPLLYEGWTSCQRRACNHRRCSDVGSVCLLSRSAGARVRRALMLNAAMRATPKIASQIKVIHPGGMPRTT
jgi:hypothetical protein